MWQWNGSWEGHGSSLPLADRPRHYPGDPVAEAVLVVGIGARLGHGAPLLVFDIATLLAATRQVVLVGDGSVSNLPPAPADEPVDEDASVAPHLPPGYAGGVFAEEVVAAATIDRRPIEHVGTTEQFLQGGEGGRGGGRGGGGGGRGGRERGGGRGRGGEGEGGGRGRGGGGRGGRERERGGRERGEGEGEGGGRGRGGRERERGGREREEGEGEGEGGGRGRGGEGEGAGRGGRERGPGSSAIGKYDEFSVQQFTGVYYLKEQGGSKVYQTRGLLEFGLQQLWQELGGIVDGLQTLD